MSPPKSLTNALVVYIFCRNTHEIVIDSHMSSPNESGIGAMRCYYYFIVFDDVIPDSDVLIQYGLRIYNRGDEKLVNHASLA